MPDSHSTAAAPVTATATEFETLQTRVQQLTAQLQAMRVRVIRAEDNAKKAGNRAAQEHNISLRLRQRVEELLEENAELEARLREEQSVSETYDYWHQAGMRPDSDEDY